MNAGFKETNANSKVPGVNVARRFIYCYCIPPQKEPPWLLRS